MPITPKLKIVKPPKNQIETIKEGHPDKRTLKKTLRIIKTITAIVDINEITAPR